MGGKCLTTNDGIHLEVIRTNWQFGENRTNVSGAIIWQRTSVDILPTRGEL